MMPLDQQTVLFYGWWQLSVCLFAFSALLAIWWHIGKIQKDFGQVWLALSILCWSISGGIDVLFLTMNWLPDYTYVNEGSRSILSLFNSLFILLSLPWFRYLPDKIEPIIKSSYWKYMIGLPFIFSLLPTIRKIFTANENTIISELDVYYSILTLIFLTIVLWESFSKRKLKSLAYLSVISILLTLSAQIFKLSGSEVNMILLSAIFKTTLIMIFFALALSWVRELSENIIPSPSQIFLSLFHIKNDDKYDHIVELRGLLDKEVRTIKLSSASFELLNKFVKARTRPRDQWLEIKPKNDSRSSKEYGINDYNELKRLLTGLLDGIFGKNSWTRDQHENILKDAFFEMSSKRERKIRLRIPPENLERS